MKKIHLNETESNLILSPLSAKLANELVFTIGEITSNQVLSNSRGVDVGSWPVEVKSTQIVFLSLFIIVWKPAAGCQKRFLTL